MRDHGCKRLLALLSLPNHPENIDRWLNQMGGRRAEWDEIETFSTPRPKLDVQEMHQAIEYVNGLRLRARMLRTLKKLQNYEH